MGIPRRKFRVPGGGTAEGTGRVCRSNNPAFRPYVVTGLDTVAERVTVSVRVATKADRAAFSAVLARHPVSIPTVGGADADLLGLNDDCTGADPWAPKLKPAARLGTTEPSSRKRKNGVCVDYARAYDVSGPRERLDAFLSDLREARVLVAEPEFRCAGIPGMRTELGRKPAPGLPATAGVGEFPRYKDDNTRELTRGCDSRILSPAQIAEAVAATER